MTTGSGEAEVKAGIVVETPPVVAEVAQEDVKAELEKSRQETEKWKQEALAHQRTVSKKDTELQKKDKELLSRIEAMSQKQDLLSQYIIDKEEAPDDLELQTKRKSEFVTKSKEISEKPKVDAYVVEKQKIDMAAAEADKLIKAQGLDMITTPELKTAFALFKAAMGTINSADAEEALEETRKVVKQMTEAKETKKVPEKSAEEIHKELKAEVLKEIYKEKGWDISDKGGSSGVGVKKELTAEEVAKMSPEDRFTRRAEIAKLPLI